MSAKIKVLITNNELSETTRDEMWEVYKKYYHYERSYFMSRIQLNNYFSFYLKEGKIVGFTGLRINRTSVGRKEYLLIYFGQTIIDNSCRGKALIPRTASKLFLKYWKDILLGRVFVWADALTYKAYLVFAKTLRDYYPTFRKRNPPHVKKLIHFVGEEYYGQNFCAASGTVKKESIVVNDRQTICPPANTSDKDILYYMKANRYNGQGHGLLTMAPVHPLNYLLIACKSIKKMMSAKRKTLQPQPVSPSHKTAILK